MTRNTEENDKLAQESYLAIERELKAQGVAYNNLEVNNFNNLNIDIFIHYDLKPKKLVGGFHHSYYRITDLWEKFERKEKFDKDVLAGFGKLIVDHFVFSAQPPMVKHK